MGAASLAELFSQFQSLHLVVRASAIHRVGARFVSNEFDAEQRLSMFEEEWHVMRADFQDELGPCPWIRFVPAKARVDESCIVSAKLTFGGIEGHEFCAEVWGDAQAFSRGEDVELFWLEHLAIACWAQGNPVAVDGQPALLQVDGRHVAAGDVADGPVVGALEFDRKDDAWGACVDRRSRAVGPNAQRAFGLVVGKGFDRKTRETPTQAKLP